ncbi:MAG: hypothetical protein M0P13_09295, partial [Fibrobacteraceae bacterium]|nr:hypothetical protein [Fibrobacteraceae bacterium]
MNLDFFISSLLDIVFSLLMTPLIFRGDYTFSAPILGDENGHFDLRRGGDSAGQKEGKMQKKNEKIKRGGPRVDMFGRG